MNKIKSRWNLSVNEMNDKHINYMLKSKFVKKITKLISAHFVKKNPEYSFDEILNVAIEGCWKAINTYDPDKGKFSNHLTFVCKTCINKYAGLTNKKNGNGKKDIVELSLRDDDSPVDYEHDFDNKIMLDKILGGISKKSREVLITHYLVCDSKKESIAYLNITRPTLEVKLETAIIEARRFIS